MRIQIKFNARNFAAVRELARRQHHELITAVNRMQYELVAEYPGIQAVLVTDEIPDMIHPEEDSAYTHVYLLNVVGADMLDVEDKAYVAWRRHRPDDRCGMCLFMYSPEETRDRFPHYVKKSDLSYYINMLGSRKESWKSTSLFAAESDCTYPNETVMSVQGSTGERKEVRGRGYQSAANINAVEEFDSDLLMAA